MGRETGLRQSSVSSESMELTRESHGSRVGGRDHSLKGDIARAYLAILLSLPVVLMLAVVLGPNYVPVLVVFFGLPVVLAVVLINFRTASKSVSIARSVGASAGWLGSRFLPEELTYLLFYLGGSILALVVYPLLIAVMVAFGIVAADRLWTVWQKRSQKGRGVAPRT